MNTIQNIALGTAIAVGFLCTAPLARAAELIGNGGFETGDFTDWNVTDQLGGSGTFSVVPPGPTPFSGNASVGPTAGNFYAISDQVGPGAHALEQSFVVPAGSTSVVVSFDMFVNDWSDLGPIVNPAGLDYTASPNQYARVDIMSAAAPPLDTGIGVLDNLYTGVDLGLDPNGYTHYSLDITSVVGAGGIFTLRFAEVDNQLFLNQGIDNVSIQAVPEPTAIVLAVPALLALLIYRQRRS